MLRSSVVGLVYAISGVLLGLFALFILVTKFDAWTSWWGLYSHLIMFIAAVGSIACIKSARMSFATRDKRLREPIGPRA